jgi:hypothetical protein
MDMRDPDYEDRERLKQFLQWREAHRAAPDRRVLFLCVGTVLGVLASLAVGALVKSSLEKPARLATEQTRPPAQQPAASPRKAASDGAASRDAVGASVEREPSKSHEAQTAAVDLEPAEDRVHTKPQRSTRIEPRTARPESQPAGARELPERSPTSASPRLREDPPDLRPSSSVTALPLPPRSIRAPLDQPQRASESAGAAAASSPTAIVMTPAVPSVAAPDLAKEITAPKDVAADGPPPLQPVPAPLDAGDTLREATAPPPGAAVTPAVPPVPRADIAKSQRSEAMETVKRLIGYMPEVRAGKAIYRWVKAQPPADAGSRPPTQESPQTQ